MSEKSERKTLSELYEEIYGRKKQKDKDDVFDTHDEYDDDDADCYTDD